MKQLGKEFTSKFGLGSKVKDRVTGFKGIVAARTQWLNNCTTYGLRSQKLEAGKPSDLEWFDEPQLKLVKPNIFAHKPDTGGPNRPVPQSNR